MLRYYNYDIVCQEIPDEVTLAVNISGCPNRCKGCHSPWLWDDVGEVLDESALDALMERYAAAVTCVCFMGGDGEPERVAQLAEHVKTCCEEMKTAWYSGREHLPDGWRAEVFDYVKTGPYVASLGGLRSATTNQRLYAVSRDGTVRRMKL